MTDPQTAWRRPRPSGPEILEVGDEVLVRMPGGSTVLTFSRQDWKDVVESAKDGAYDI